MRAADLTGLHRVTCGAHGDISNADPCVHSLASGHTHLLFGFKSTIKYKGHFQIKKERNPSKQQYMNKCTALRSCAILSPVIYCQSGATRHCLVSHTS